MFQVKDTILYGSDGICVIEEITSRTFHGKTQDYYVLRPVYSNPSTIYVPVGSEKLLAKMRKLLSAEEIHEMIRAMPEEALLWVENENQRKQTYSDILHSGDRRAMVRMIKTLYLRQQDLKNSGRKFHACDERFLKEAERIVYHEFAHVLRMEPGEIPAFILKELEAAEDCCTSCAD